MAISNLITLLVLLPFTKCHNVSNLIATIVVFRHGARTPLLFFGNDPYANKSYWPQGIGELTERGRIEAYQLGQWLRERYDGFLPTEYSKEDIYIRSSDIDRSIISAQLAAAGLYSSQNNNFSFNYLTVPVHTVPIEDDSLLRTYKQCTKFYTMYENYSKSDYFIKISNYSILNPILLKHLGQEIEPHLVGLLHETWSIEEAHNLSLPEWTSEVYPDITAKIAGLDYIARTYSKETAQMAIGVLLHDLKTYFLQMKNLALSKTPVSDEYLPKMKLYSGHDFNLVDIKNVLGIYDYKFVNTSSAVIIELRQILDSFYVNLYFKDQDSVEKLKLEECDFDCELDTFLNVIEPVTLTTEEWKKRCFHCEEKCYGTVCCSILLLMSILIVIFLTVYLMYRGRSQPCNNQDCPECKYKKHDTSNNTILNLRLDK